MAEWFKAPVLKTGVRASAPWVRIPPHPPVYAEKSHTNRHFPDPPSPLPLPIFAAPQRRQPVLFMAAGAELGSPMAFWAFLTLSGSGSPFPVWRALRASHCLSLLSSAEFSIVCNGAKASSTKADTSAARVPWGKWPPGSPIAGNRAAAFRARRSVSHPFGAPVR